MQGSIRLHEHRREARPAGLKRARSAPQLTWSLRPGEPLRSVSRLLTRRSPVQPSADRLPAHAEKIATARPAELGEANLFAGIGKRRLVRQILALDEHRQLVTLDAPLHACVEV